MFEEDDTEMLTPNYWATTTDDNILAIDAILNHRLRQDISTSFVPKTFESSNNRQTKISIT